MSKPVFWPQKTPPHSPRLVRLFVFKNISLGLLRLGLVQQIAAAYLDQMMGGARDDVEEKKRPRGEVGYDAHLGGAIAGVLWHVPPLLAVKRRR